MPDPNPMRADPAPLVESLETLTPDSPREAAIALLERVAVFREVLREMSREVDAAYQQAFIAWIDANGDIEVGNQRYYVGVNKSVRVNDVRQTLETVFAECGGSMDDVAAALSVSAFKPGACRQLLGSAFDKHFTTTETPDIKTGKPKRRVKHVDTKFLGSDDDD